MRVRVNEIWQHLDEGATLYSVRALFHPAADIVIRNGAVADYDAVLTDGDVVALIQRGQLPSKNAFDALLSARHTPGVFEKMKAATVGIAGLGGLGSAVAVALARVGVGRLILCDHDVVEPSNLNRQHYFIDQIGMKKTDALSATLRRIHPELIFELHDIKLTQDNAATVFADAQILVEALDRAESKAMLLGAWLATHSDRPVVCGSGMAGAFSANTIQTKRKMGKVYVVGDGEAEAKEGQGLMAPRVGVAAHHQATAVMRLILGLDPEC